MKTPHLMRRAASIRPLAFASLALSTASTVRADLAAYWDFNGTTPYGVSVDLRAGLAPRVLGGAAASADAGGYSGVAGDRAMTFGTGQQRLHLADASYFTGVAAGDVMSVSYWIRHATVKQSTSLSFVAPSTAGARGFQAHSPWSDNGIYFDTGGCCGATMRTAFNPGATWLGTWRHMTLVKNGATKEIYRDGILLATGNNTAPIAVAFTELYIGNASLLTEAVNGVMDDFAVYSHALTAADAVALAAGASPLTLATTLTDNDGDSLPDMWEVRVATNTTTLTAALVDNDLDGLSNADELARGTNPLVPDSDADGALDGVETNTGMWASLSDRGTNPLNPDTDGDGLKDGVETNSGAYLNAASTGTNPHTTDYDSDLSNDGIEVLYGSNPVNSLSTPILSGVPTLLAWWEFNDASNPAVATDTRVGHTGNILSLAAYSPDAEGQTGAPGDRALRITGGGGKLRLENASNWINLATRLDKLTLSFWQKNAVATPAAGQSSFWLVSPSSADGARGFQAHCPWASNTIYYDTGGASNAGVRINGPVAQDWSVWHHYVFLKNGTTKKIYVDGTERLSGTGAIPLKTDFTALNIGSDNGTGSMQGWLDDFAIFAATLSTQDITDLATRAKTPGQISSSADNDGDGLTDAWEYLYFPGDLTKLAGGLADYDMDGSRDSNELAKDTNPNDSDTDDDGLLDGPETGTGMWFSASDRGTNPKNVDSDSDGLRDNVETNTGSYSSPADTGTNPNLADTDGDTFRDGLEIPYGSNPTQGGSVPFTAGQSFLLALWNFNNASVPAAANDVVAGFPGATTGTYSADMGGRSGAAGDLAMCFAPDQAVTANGSFINLAAPADAFTISFWQKLNSIRQSSAFWVTSPSAGTASGFRGIQAHAPWADSNIYFDHSGCCDANVQRISGPLPAMDITDWHHFAFLKNGATKQVYVDGVLAVNGLSGVPLVNDLTTLTIGGGPAGYTDGCIDDFAIFAGGLTHEQICRLHAGESPQAVLTPAPGGPFMITSSLLLPLDKIRLTWNSTPGCVYRVESSTDLTAGSWSNLATNIPSEGTSTVEDFQLPAGAPRIFLRVTEQ